MPSIDKGEVSERIWWGREAVNGVPGPRCSVGVGLLP